MKITRVARKGKYEIRLIEFVAPAGWIITYFYQLFKNSGGSLGCTNSREEALLWLKNPLLIEEKIIAKSQDFYLGKKVLIGVDELSAGVIR